MALPGFEQLLATCRRHGLPVELWAPTGLPRTGEILGTPLDPELAQVFAVASGGYVWDLFLFGGPGAARELAADNADARLGSDEPLYNQLVMYAQVGHQAAYLATVPALANARGLQPVVYADFNEAPEIRPLASTVDRGFASVDAYINRMLAQGTLDAADLEHLPFSLALPDLVPSDGDLMALINAGRFDTLCTDTDAADFFASVGRR